MVPTGAKSTYRLVIVNRSPKRTPPIYAVQTGPLWNHQIGPDGRASLARREPVFTRGQLIPRHRLIAPGRHDADALGSLAAYKAATLEVAAPTRRRGISLAAPRSLWLYDPFGLWGAQVGVVPGATLVVYPPSLKRRLAPFTNAPTFGCEGYLPRPHEPAGTTGGNGEFVDLQPYQAGDRLNLIHWPSLARYGITLVRRFNEEDTPKIRIVLDDRPRVHRPARFEAMLSCALAASERLSTSQTTVDLVTLSGLETTIGPGDDDHARLLEFLACVLPSEVAADLQLSALSPFILFTTSTARESLPDHVTQRAMVIES